MFSTLNAVRFIVIFLSR